METISSKVLDHGYVTFVESWGSDERVIESARMSTAKGFIGWEKDAKLLRYLYEHSHMTPFEMCGATFEIQAPIFVFREWQRHRTQSYNELSARYTELPDLFYIPSVERLQASKQDLKNRQGSVGGFTADEALDLQYDIAKAIKEARLTYEELLFKGVSREVARVLIPVAQYSRMRASANLRNWMGFLTLRMDEGAQWEIRAYAGLVHDTLKEVFPRVMELFDGQ